MIKSIVRRNIKTSALCAGNSLRGFTLTEIMTVAIIIGLMAAFAIPNYEKTVRKAHERTAIAQLIALHGANEIYRTKNGDYLQGAGLDLAAINNGLSIDIIADGMTYSYTYTAGPPRYAATAAWTTGAGFTIRVTNNPIKVKAVAPLNPCCFGGGCPSLSGCG